MNTGADQGAENYAYLWRAAPYEVRWVIWNSAGDTMVFDREINCPVFIDDEATLSEVLHRMRAAGAPESDEYPGRPCARVSAG